MWGRVRGSENDQAKAKPVNGSVASIDDEGKA
jgi:hypothetical protein